LFMYLLSTRAGGVGVSEFEATLSFPFLNQR
jgi:hypothetical protein